MSQGFGLRHNRPTARTFSPARLALLGIALVAVILAGFVVPTLLRGRGDGNGETSAFDGRKPAAVTRRFGFEDAPRSYSDLGRIEPVNVFHESPVVAKAEPEPQVIVREVVREVPVNRAPVRRQPSQAELQDEAARNSPVTFGHIGNEQKN